MDCQTEREYEKRNRASRDCRLRKIGWSEEIYQAAYLKQEGKCAICDKFELVLWADHNHETGIRRELLCNGCNSGIGMLQDNSAVVLKAVEYLEKHGC
jgi:hypothetical protein